MLVTIVVVANDESKIGNDQRNKEHGTKKRISCVQLCTGTMVVCARDDRKYFLAVVIATEKEHTLYISRHSFLNE